MQSCRPGFFDFLCICLFYTGKIRTYPSIQPPLSFGKIHTEKLHIRIQKGAIGTSGPGAFQLALLTAIANYTGRCKFTSEAPSYEVIEANNDKHVFFYNVWPNDVYNKVSEIYTRSPQKLHQVLFGPIPVPDKWFRFPNPSLPQEKYFRQMLTKLGGWVIHTERVFQYMSKRSGTRDLRKQYALVSACTELGGIDVLPWCERIYDIILFEKYPDRDRARDGSLLYRWLIKLGLKVARLRYGGYTHDQMREYAETSKAVIYFSFYDTGAIGLREIQNYGVFTFAHQVDQVEDPEIGCLISELDGGSMRVAARKIKREMKELEKSQPNTTKIRKLARRLNSCDRALHQLCDFVTDIAR